MYPLISTWTINQGSERRAVDALKNLAQQVYDEEPDTLVYLPHVPDMTQQSMPTPPSVQVVFFEIYADKDAFDAHVNGPVFKGFVAEYGSLFLSTEVTCPDGGGVSNPYTTVEFLQLLNGFIRQGVLAR
jgi:quinol monooxygenase YgiN